LCYDNFGADEKEGGEILESIALHVEVGAGFDADPREVTLEELVGVDGTLPIFGEGSRR
jgi:hypothetical protein